MRLQNDKNRVSHHKIQWSSFARDRLLYSSNNTSYYFCTGNSFVYAQFFVLVSICITYIRREHTCNKLCVNSVSPVQCTCERTLCTNKEKKRKRRKEQHAQPTTVMQNAQRKGHKDYCRNVTFVKFYYRYFFFFFFKLLFRKIKFFSSLFYFINNKILSI